jgi:hypothetical protein
LPFVEFAVQLFADFLSDELSSAAGPEQHRYLVVDTAATRPADLAHELAIGAQAIDILTGESCVWRESASPVLIELTRDAVRSAICRGVAEALAKWRYANCFVFIESPHARDAVIQMLRERTEAVLPQNMPVLLRFFDSRVFAALLKTLSTNQLTSLLAVGSRWALPGRHGELHRIDSDAESAVVEFLWPIDLDTKQETALIEAGEADAMIDLLLNQNNAALLALLPPEQHQRISAALVAAKALGVEHLADQVAYCALDMELGSKFHEHEPWVSALCDARPRRTAFTDLVAQVAEKEGA